MPRYRVTEIRAYKSVVIIDAENERAARQLDGEIISEEDNSHDSWAESMESVEEIGADEEE